MTFFLHPSKALLILEQESLLNENFAITNPLRRSHSPQECVLMWHSTHLEEKLSAIKNKAETQLIYFARRGARFDGHSLIERVLEKNQVFVGEYARALDFLEQAGRPGSWIEDVLSHPHFIPVSSVELSLNLLLIKACGLTEKDFFVHGITGTNGKTSTVHIASHLYRRIFSRECLRIGTLGIWMGESQKEGSHPTMPDFPSLLSSFMEAKRLGIDTCFMEATSHGLKQGRLGPWHVQSAGFTNLTQDHLDYHKTFQDYKNSKGILFLHKLSEQGTACLNYEDDHAPFFIGCCRKRQRKIGFGRHHKKAKFFALHPKNSTYLEWEKSSSTAQGIRGKWTLWDSDTNQVAEASYSCPLLGDFQHDNLTTAATLLLSHGASLRDIAAASPHIPAIPGRLENAPSGKNLPTVLVDYAHTPDALEKALLTTQKLVPSGGKLICIFGCGGDRDPSKRPLMGEMAFQHSDFPVATSDNPRTEDPEKILKDVLNFEKGDKKFLCIVDRREAIVRSIIEADEKDVILIAGKGHENYQIVGTSYRPWSDLEIAKSALKRRQE